jgi:circadian clock protein KaiC
MNQRRLTRNPTESPSLPKTPTGIRGLDEITEGGLPKGWPTLVCGAAGCGRTLLAIEDITCNRHVPINAAS